MRKRGFVAIYSSPSMTGKTTAIKDRLLKASGKSAYFTAEEFTDLYTATIKNGNKKNLISLLKRYDLVAIDDIDMALMGYTNIQYEVAEMISCASKAGTDIILAGIDVKKRLPELVAALRKKLRFRLRFHHFKTRRKKHEKRYSRKALS